MSGEQPSERLSRLATRWSLVRKAHDTAGGHVATARAELAQRYLPVIYDYLLGAVHDVEAAEELSQEFMLRLLSGRLRGADPQKGKFRNYVRTVLINLVNDHQRQRGRQLQLLAEHTTAPVCSPETSEEAELSDEERFKRLWRRELLNQTWEALRLQHATYHAVLRLRLDNPDLSSRELSVELERIASKTLSPAGIRKTLERAQKKFAQLLAREVARGLEDPTDEVLRKELKELGLYSYCASAIDSGNKN